MNMVSTRGIINKWHAGPYEMVGALNAWNDRPEAVHKRSISHP